MKKPSCRQVSFSPWRYPDGEETSKCQTIIKDRHLAVNGTTEMYIKAHKNGVEVLRALRQKIGRKNSGIRDNKWPTAPVGLYLSTSVPGTL